MRWTESLVIRLNHSVVKTLVFVGMGFVLGCASSGNSNSGVPVETTEPAEAALDSGGTVDTGIPDASTSEASSMDEEDGAGAAEGRSLDTNRADEADHSSETSEMDEGGTQEEALPDFATLGPYYAGYRVVEWTYALPGVEEPRTIEIGLWYPTELPEGEVIKWGGLLEEEDLYGGAPVIELPAGETFPVRVYTHGDKGLMGDSSNTSEFFASHGWVTIAPNHTGNTLLDYISPRPAWMFYARPWDVTQALNFMESIDGDPLSGKLKLDEVVLMGHSYGGYTGYGLAGATFDYPMIESACNGGEGPLSGPCTEEQTAQFNTSVSDPRVIAYAPLDGGNHNMYGEEGVQTVNMPLFQMYAISPDGEAHKGSEAYWSWLQEKNMTRVGIVGGCHIGFTLGYCEGISDEENFGIIHAYLMAFSNHILLDLQTPESIGLLMGEWSVSDNVVYERTEAAETFWNAVAAEL